MKIEKKIRKTARRIQRAAGVIAGRVESVLDYYRDFTPSVEKLSLPELASEKKRKGRRK